ncbi:hypothetical protein HDU98_010767 [Podochytrium sp. JEL0797]|nr:hypothetical protein HDU98_010767 [Podochytrium sp. JEL0797]
MSSEILGKMDEMGTRIQELESSLEELVKQADVDDTEASNASITSSIQQQQNL